MFYVLFWRFLSRSSPLSFHNLLRYFSGAIVWGLTKLVLYLSACLFLFVFLFSFSLFSVFFLFIYLLLRIYYDFLNLSADFSVVFISIFLKSFRKQPFFSPVLLWSDVCCLCSSFRLSLCYDVFVSDFFFSYFSLGSY